jgi:hypothetical protein
MDASNPLPFVVHLDDADVAEVLDALILGPFVAGHEPPLPGAAPSRPGAAPLPTPARPGGTVER